MKTRPPLNGLTPRTMREARRDPYDWWRASPRPSTPAEHLAGAIIFIVIMILGAIGLLHWWLK
jgi:hypothetical protein